MFAFLAGPDTTRTGFGGYHVDEVLAAAPDRIRPRPTVMRILNDAGIARYSREEIEAGLRRDAITMRVSARRDAVLIMPISADVITDVERLMRLAAPCVVVRGASDYWLHGTLSASMCPVAVDGWTTRPVRCGHGAARRRDRSGPAVGLPASTRSQSPGGAAMIDVVPHPTVLASPKPATPAAANGVGAAVRSNEAGEGAGLADTGSGRWHRTSWISPAGSISTIIEQ